MLSRLATPGSTGPEEPQPGRNGQCLCIAPNGHFCEVSRADILCIPGGFGCTDVMHEDALGWVREVGADAQWVTSVCTRIAESGRSGLLQALSRHLALAWRDYLRLFGAEPISERVVFDRNRVTGGGVTAGIDFALALTPPSGARIMPCRFQTRLEYESEPAFDSGRRKRPAQT